MDHNLIFDEHVDMLCGKLASLNFLLKRISPFLTKETKMLFYNSYVQSILIYCLCTWGLCNKSTLDQVFKMQKRICRTITGDFESPSSHVMGSLGVLNLHDQVVLNVACLVYKCLNNLAPQPLFSLLNPTTSLNIYAIRNNSINVHIPFSRTETRKRAISFAGAKIWNSIPTDVRRSHSLTLFKMNMKNMLLHKS